MALKLSQALSLLDEAGHSYFAYLLREYFTNQAYRNSIDIDNTDCPNQTLTKDNLENFINELLSKADRNNGAEFWRMINNNLMPGERIIANNDDALNMLAPRREALKVSLQVVEACKKSGIEKALRPLLAKMFSENAGAEFNKHNVIAVKKQLIGKSASEINTLVENLKQAIIGLNINAADFNNAVQNVLRGDQKILPADFAIENLADTNALKKIVQSVKLAHRIDEAGGLAASPAFKNTLTELTDLPGEQFIALSEKGDLVRINTLPLTDVINPNAARELLATQFFAEGLAEGEEKTNIKNIVMNAGNLSDEKIKQMIGEARLKEYLVLGDKFTEMFADVPAEVFQAYLQLCQTIGGFEKYNWQDKLKNLIKARPQAIDDGANECYKMIEGYMALHEACGEEGLAKNTGIKFLRQVAVKLGGLPDDAQNKLLESFNKEAIKNKSADVVNFRALVASKFIIAPGAAVTDDDISNEQAKRIIAALRMQTVFANKSVINTALNKVLKNPILELASDSPLWLNKLKEVEASVKKSIAAIQAGDTNRDQLAELAAKLRILLKDYLTDKKQNPPVQIKIDRALAAQIVGHYQFAQLIELLNQQGLSELADPLTRLTISNEVNPIQQHLTEMPLAEANIRVKIKQLKQAIADKVSVDGLTSSVKEFITGLVKANQEDTVLQKLAPSLHASARQIFVNLLYQQLLEVTRQFIGDEAVHQLKVIETLIKDYIKDNIGENPDGVSTKITDAFTKNNLIGKAVVLQETLMDAANPGAAKMVFGVFLNGLIADKVNNIDGSESIKNAVNKILNNEEVFQSIKKDLRRASILEAIKLPVIADWLREYLDKNGKPLALTYRHIHVINKIFDSSFERLSKHIIEQRITHLKLTGELPSNFPDKLFGKADNVENANYSVSDWQTESIRLSPLYEIHDLKLRKLALNASALAEIPENELKHDVKAINTWLEQKGATITADDYKNNVFIGRFVNEDSLFARFAANDALVEQCVADHARAFRIRKYVKNKPLADLLISNPRALKGKNEDEIRQFADAITTAISQSKEETEKCFLKYELGYKNADGTVNENEDFYELFMDENYQNYRNYQLIQSSFDMEAIRRTALGDINRISELLNNRQNELKRYHPEVLALQQRSENKGIMETFERDLKKLQADLVASKEQLYKEKQYRNALIEKLEQAAQGNTVAEIDKLKKEIRQIAKLIGQCIDSIQQVQQKLQIAEQSIIESSQALEPTAKFSEGMQKINFLSDRKFHVVWRDINTLNVSTLRKEYSTDGMSGSARIIPSSVDLTSPLDHPDYKAVFVGQNNAETIVVQKDPMTLLFKRLPGQKTSKGDHVFKQEKTKKEVSLFINTYLTAGQAANMTEKKLVAELKKMEKEFTSLTVENFEAAKSLASLTWGCAKESDKQRNSINISVINNPELSNPPGQAFVAVFLLELYILKARAYSNIEIHGARSNDFDHKKLEYAAKQMIAYQDYSQDHDDENSMDLAPRGSR